MPVHLVCPFTVQLCGVSACAAELLSQMSISVQQVPHSPTPELESLEFQPRMLASPSMNLMSCGHCAAG